MARVALLPRPCARVIHVILVDCCHVSDDFSRPIGVDWTNRNPSGGRGVLLLPSNGTLVRHNVSALCRTTLPQGHKEHTCVSRSLHTYMFFQDRGVVRTPPMGKHPQSRALRPVPSLYLTHCQNNQTDEYNPHEVVFVYYRIIQGQPGGKACDSCTITVIPR